MINVYESKETNFTHNGLVVLSECTSALITEELNGRYELELEHLLDKRGKWKNLVEDNIIKVDGQLFRIYHKSTNLISRKVNARHIFYDLLDNLVNNIDIRGLSCINALNRVMSNLAYSTPFTHSSDVSKVNTINSKDSSGDVLDIDPLHVILNLVDIYGSELLRNNFDFKMLNSIGLDRGVLISYGKNIQEIEEYLDLDSVKTVLKPIGKDGLLLPEIFINSPYINSYSNPKILVVKFDNITTQTELRAAGTQYFIDSKCDIPQFNYNINFIELSKTMEYKNYAVLETVHLGDTVTIKHSKLNINLKAKVIKTLKNALTNRLEKVELGSFKPSLSSSIESPINEVKKEIVQVTSDYQKAIDKATALITGSEGGNVVIRQHEDGKPYEILIMDTDNVNTASNVWRWDIGGFGHSDTGINGPYNTAITQDGSIVSSFLTALNITGSEITAGIIKSKNGKWEMDLDGETFKLGNALSFNGTNVTLGSGVSINWTNVTPPTASDVGADPSGTASSLTSSDNLTKTNGQELLSQQFKGGVNDGFYPYATIPPITDYNYTSNGVKTRVLQLTGQSRSSYSEFIPVNGNSKIWVSGNVYTSATSLVYVGIEHYDANKVALGENSACVYAYAATPTPLTWTAFGKFDTLMEGCAYIKLRLLANWSAGQTGDVLFGNLSAKQLGATNVHAYTTKITEDGVYTGTVTANQVNTGTILSTDGKVKIGIDSGAGVEITGGVLTVKNNNNAVVIDGSKVALQVKSQGYISLVCPSGQSSTTYEITHNLGASPTAVLFAMDASPDHKMYPMPHIGYSWVANDYYGVQYVCDCQITDTKLIFVVNRSDKVVNSGTMTWYFSYQILTQSYQ